VVERSTSVPNTWTLKGGALGVKIIWQISIIMLKRMNDQIWHGNTGGKKHISTESDTPTSQAGRTPASPPQIFWNSYPPTYSKTV